MHCMLSKDQKSHVARPNSGFYPQVRIHTLLRSRHTLRAPSSGHIEQALVNFSPKHVVVGFFSDHLGPHQRCNHRDSDCQQYGRRAFRKPRLPSVDTMTRPIHPGLHAVWRSVVVCAGSSIHILSVTSLLFHPHFLLTLSPGDIQAEILDYRLTRVHLSSVCRAFHQCLTEELQNGIEISTDTALNSAEHEQHIDLPPDRHKRCRGSSSNAGVCASANNLSSE
jgi:hypothetical protein